MLAGTVCTSSPDNNGTCSLLRNSQLASGFQCHGGKFPVWRGENVTNFVIKPFFYTCVVIVAILQWLVCGEKYSWRGDSCKPRKNFLDVKKSWFMVFIIDRKKSKSFLASSWLTDLSPHILLKGCSCCPPDIDLSVKYWHLHQGTGIKNKVKPPHSMKLFR